VSTTTSKTVAAGELRGRVESHKDVRILDVRTPAEFETAHIPGAYNIPLDRLPEAISELKHVSDELVVVCQSGARATKACEALQGAGLTGVELLDGGMQAWQAVGGEVNTGKPTWALERQVRLVAGAIVLTSILTSLKFPRARFVAGAIGGGLTFSALSNTCAMGSLLMKLPYNSGDVDVQRVVARMKSAEVK
jgi:rhodanese-related sulfurtransferase